MENPEILIIEDEIIIAQDIELTIEDLGYKSQGIIDNSTEAIDYLSFHSPDLVLCDITIKGPQDGVEVAKAVRAKKNIPFVFLTSLSDRHTLSRAKEALPYGYIVKPFNEKDLLTSIEIALHKFEQELSQVSLDHKGFNQLANQPLTDQEYKVLDLIVKGHTTNDIAQVLFISNNTIKYHIRNILSKMDVASRTGLLQKILNSFMK